MDLQSFGKWLVVAGAAAILLGLALQFFPRIPYIGRLPGDIVIKRGQFTFYFPLATCLLISVILALVARFFGHK